MTPRLGERVHRLTCHQFFQKCDSLSGWLERQGVSNELDSTEFCYTADGPDGVVTSIDPHDPPPWLDSLVASVVAAHWLCSSDYLFFNAIVDYIALCYAICVDVNERIWEIIDLDGRIKYVYGKFDGYYQVVELEEAIHKYGYCPDSVCIDK